MEIKKSYLVIAITSLTLLLVACMPVETASVSPNIGPLEFSGGTAFAHEQEYVAKFPNRHSGQANNHLRAEWFAQELTMLGWQCSLDQWEIINYSQVVPLVNASCILKGQSQHEILVVAHHDQAPTTIEGADNDASGIAILVQMAEIFSAETPVRHSLVFASIDAEEYGMIGSKRLIQSHPNPEQIVAGISLDNLGRYYYDGMDIELIGQYRNYGPVWLPLLARDAAAQANANWEVSLRSPLDQFLDQAGPISFMDQGPMVSAGVPAVGFTGRVPAEFVDEHYRLWHDPDDTIDNQDPVSLENAGQVVEATIRALQALESFPRQSGPYIFFESDGSIMDTVLLMPLFLAFVAIFFLLSFLAWRAKQAEMLTYWKQLTANFVALWLPLFSSILVLYLLVATGVMQSYDTYPATTKDPNLLNPDWFAITIYIIALVLLLKIGRIVAGKYINIQTLPSEPEKRSFAFLILGACAIYIMVINPFSLLFIAPTILWYFIRGRAGFGFAADLVLFVMGGLFFYALFYFFGFVTLRYNLAFLWFLMNMFSIQMISPPTAAVIAAVVASGIKFGSSCPTENRSQLILNFAAHHSYCVSTIHGE